MSSGIEQALKAHTIGYLVDRAYHTSAAHGFWSDLDVESVTVRLAKLALITSEVGEAVEAVRKDDLENLGEELADICIRVFDLAGACRIDLQAAVIQKMSKNDNRPHMHGKLA